MQLDRTEIVIRQRSALELFDLSLLVLKRHYRPLALASAIIGIPLLLIDVWLISWIVDENSYFIAEDVGVGGIGVGWRYIGHLLALYVLQFPIASLPTTLFLGSQIFYEPMSVRKLLGLLRPIVLPSIFVLGFLRLGLVGLLLEPLVSRAMMFDPRSEIWLLFVIPAIALLMRAFWPFAPEIIGLERCPLRAKDSSTISYVKRSNGLHKSLQADHFSRFFGALTYAALLTGMLVGGALFVQGVLTGDWIWNNWFHLVVLPVSMWLVSIYIAVFRFLSYLDSRIRLEGWEIELRMRAEGDRLTHRNQPTINTGISAEGVS